MIYILHLVVISYLKVRSYMSFQRNPCKPKVSETKMYGKLSLFVNSETINTNLLLTSYETVPNHPMFDSP